MSAIHNIRADPFTDATDAKLLSGEIVEVQWQLLYRIAAWVSLVAVGLIPISITAFIIWPPPETVSGHFVLLQEHWLLGMFYRMNLEYRYEVAAIVIDWVTLIFMGVLLSVFFRRATPVAQRGMP